jgi:hypothetical protein
MQAFSRGLVAAPEGGGDESDGVARPWGRGRGGWQQELLWGEAGSRRKIAEVRKEGSEQVVCGDGSASRSIFCHTWGVPRGAQAGAPRAQSVLGLSY